MKLKLATVQMTVGQIALNDIRWVLMVDGEPFVISVERFVTHDEAMEKGKADLQQLNMIAVEPTPPTKRKRKARKR